MPSIPTLRLFVSHNPPHYCALTTACDDDDDDDDGDDDGDDDDNGDDSQIVSYTHLAFFVAFLRLFKGGRLLAGGQPLGDCDGDDAND